MLKSQDNSINIMPKLAKKWFKLGVWEDIKHNFCKKGPPKAAGSVQKTMKFWIVCHYQLFLTGLK